jgi:hypothetical protein
MANLKYCESNTLRPKINASHENKRNKTQPKISRFENKVERYTVWLKKEIDKRSNDGAIGIPHDQVMLHMNELLSKFPKQTSLALACRTQSQSRREKEVQEIQESIYDTKSADLVMRRVKNGTEKIYTSEQVKKDLGL